MPEVYSKALPLLGKELRGDQPRPVWREAERTKADESNPWPTGKYVPNTKVVPKQETNFSTILGEGGPSLRNNRWPKRCYHASQGGMVEEEGGGL